VLESEKMVKIRHLTDIVEKCVLMYEGHGGNSPAYIREVVCYMLRRCAQLLSVEFVNM